MKRVQTRCHSDRERMLTSDTPQLSSAQVLDVRYSQKEAMTKTLTKAEEYGVVLDPQLRS